MEPTGCWYEVGCRERLVGRCPYIMVAVPWESKEDKVSFIQMVVLDASSEGARVWGWGVGRQPGI